MTRFVHCRKYGRPLPGLDRPPYPGPKGEAIYQHISKQAWEAWQQQQTMLINERRLSMLNPDDRQFLAEEMEKFFSNQSFAQATGYVPLETKQP